MTVDARSLIDAAGVAHPVAPADARIVSLVPSVTELVVDLGLGANLVGRTKWCIHPEDAVRDVPTVGGTKKVNLDKVRALQPTHVLLNVDENTREMAEALAEFVPNVVVTHPIDPRDNIALYRLIGGIFGRDREAEALCEAFESAYERLIAQTADLPERRVLYLIWKDPWMTVSRDTYISRTLNLIHWTTVGHDDAVRYPEIAIDDEFSRDIDHVLFSSEPYAFKESHLEEFAAAYHCEREKLMLIDGEMTSWYGSRAIMGLDYLSRLARDPIPN